MSDPLLEVLAEPRLIDPVQLLALDGWIDAAGVARAARQRLVDGDPGQRIARFDVDRLLDHRARPVVQIPLGADDVSLNENGSKRSAQISPKEVNVFQHWMFSRIPPMHSPRASWREGTGIQQQGVRLKISSRTLGARGL